MSTPVQIDVDLLEKTALHTGIEENTTLVRLGLEILISRKSAKRLPCFGGIEPDLEVPPRRRQ